MSKKKQKEAINSLVVMIDELDNKPRRLFESLREVAAAFLKDDDHRQDVVSSIDQFEEYYYLFKNIPEMVRGVAQASIDVKRELMKKSQREEKQFYIYESGVDDCRKEMSKKIIEYLIDED